MKNKRVIWDVFLSNANRRCVTKFDADVNVDDRDYIIRCWRFKWQNHAMTEAGHCFKSLFLDELAWNLPVAEMRGMSRNNSRTLMTNDCWYFCSRGTALWWTKKSLRLIYRHAVFRRWWSSYLDFLTTTDDAVQETVSRTECRYFYLETYSADFGSFVRRQLFQPNFFLKLLLEQVFFTMLKRRPKTSCFCSFSCCGWVCERLRNSLLLNLSSLCKRLWWL